MSLLNDFGQYCCVALPCLSGCFNQNRCVKITTGTITNVVTNVLVNVHNDDNNINTSSKFPYNCLNCDNISSADITTGDIVNVETTVIVNVDNNYNNITNSVKDSISDPVAKLNNEKVNENSSQIIIPGLSLGNTKIPQMNIPVPFTSQNL